MKNYLFFNNKQQGWNNNFKDFQCRIHSLKTFLQFFYPPYVLNNTIIVDGEDNKKTAEYWRLKPHEYCYIQEPMSISGLSVQPGYILLSNARNEGESVHNNFPSSLQSQIQNYFLQPIGNSDYFDILVGFLGVRSSYSSGSNLIDLQQKFNFTFTNLRWAFNTARDSTDNQEIQFSNINSYDVEGHQHAFYQTEVTPLFFLRYQPDNSINYEELITDMTVQRDNKNQKFVLSNVPKYNLIQIYGI